MDNHDPSSNASRPTPTPRSLPEGLVVAVTGHRPQSFTADAAVFARSELARVATKLAPSVGLSGMALGADTWWAELMVERHISLHAYVPFPAQPDRWPATDQAHYRELLERAAHVEMVAPSYHRGAFHARNDALVANADAVVAVWTGVRTGGTAHAVSLAKKAKRPIVWIDPTRRRTSLIHPAS